MTRTIIRTMTMTITTTITITVTGITVTLMMPGRIYHCCISDRGGCSLSHFPMIPVRRFYLVCSFTQVPYTLLLALFRVVKLVASTLFGAMARLDVNLFTMFRFLDDGYNCFVAVVCMERALRAKEVWGWALVR